MPSGAISLLRVETNSAPINSEKSTTELNGPHYTDLNGPINSTLELEIHQHLRSIKHVINIIMWIRDTEYYMTFPIYSVEIELHDRSKRCANLCYNY
jgi:hypothetical protein